MSKSLPADLTTVRPLARMNPLVHDQLRALRERCATIGTAVRFKFVVDAHMLRQMPLEHLVADSAVERLDVLVETGQVLVQGVRTEKALKEEMKYFSCPSIRKVILIVVAW